MKTSLAHLSSTKRNQLQTVSTIIEKAVRPEKIILFGSFASGNGELDLVTSSQNPVSLYSYDLLVVTRRNDQRQDHTLQDIIENRCRFSTPVNVIIHDIDYVNQCLAEGVLFFCTVLEEAVLLYDAGSIPFAASNPPDFPRILKNAIHDLEQWSPRANAFFQSAVFNQKSHQVRIAAFLLHQATEQAYQMIILTFTGYKPCTHNVDKLRRYTNRFSVELVTLFPRNTPEEDRLFKILIGAYVDARYKEDYPITENELSALIGRVGQFLAIGHKICRNRLTYLEKMARKAA